MATKKKPTQEDLDEIVKDIPFDGRIISIDSVVDGQLTKIEWYLTDERVDDTSKLIRHQDDGQLPVNKFFTKYTHLD